MSPLILLSLRLARAGGTFRMAAIILANAVGIVVLLISAALPGAMTPESVVVTTDERVQALAVTSFLAVPVAVLLLTVGRLASATRDQRLASLRVLGLSPVRTRVVAAGENGGLAAVGVVIGLVLFHLMASLVDVGTGGWFLAPLRVTAGTAALIGGGAVALAVVTSIAGTWTLTRDPRRARSQSTRRGARPWPFVPLMMGIAALWVLAEHPQMVRRWVGPTEVPVAHSVIFLVGTLSCAVGVAVLPPVLATWAGGLLVRMPPVSATLAGRAMQTASAGAGRLVAGVGVTAFLAVAVFGWLDGYLSTPDVRFADQMVNDGPQVMTITSGALEPGFGLDGEPGEPLPFTAADHAALTAVPGVISTWDNWDFGLAGCGSAEELCLYPFIGTCDDLSHLMTVTGCDDGRAATILASNIPAGATQEELRDLKEIDPALRPTIVLTGMGVQTPQTPRLEVVASGQPIVQDVAATMATWVFPWGYPAFVPSKLVAGVLPTSGHATLVAEGGPVVRAAISEVADARGLVVLLNPTDAYVEAMRMRAAVLTLAAIIIGIGLLSVAISAFDRARERRRPIARLVAVGAPVRILRTGQLLQTMVPLVISVALGGACGLLLVRALAAFDDNRGLVITASMPALAVSVLTGVVLVSLATLPMTRARLTPEMLRQE